MRASQPFRAYLRKTLSLPSGKSISERLEQYAQHSIRIWCNGPACGQAGYRIGRVGRRPRTLRPIPTTTTGSAHSSRMPAILAPRTSTSFGHLSSALTEWGRNRSTVSATASAATKLSSATSPGVRCARNKIDAYRLPTGLCQCRARRPRPAVCWRAHTTVPCAAPTEPNAAPHRWLSLRCRNIGRRR